MSPLSLLMLLQQSGGDRTDDLVFNSVGLIVIGVISVLLRIGRVGGAGWLSLFGSSVRVRDYNSGGLNLHIGGQPFNARLRLTSPPLPDPAYARRERAAQQASPGRQQSAADAYQQQLDTWLLERGMDPLDSDHVTQALAANPYDPARYAPQPLPSNDTAPQTATAAFQSPALEWQGPGQPAAPVTPQPLPQQVQELLWMYPGQWWVAGGWALDLWLGRLLRPHADIEIAIPRFMQNALRTYLTQFRFTQVVKDAAGTAREEPLAIGVDAAPPVHELHARRYSGAGVDPSALGQLEVLLNETEGGLWVYRRDGRITLPLMQLGGVSAEGIPYLAPEVVLLYKAGSSAGLRPVDEQDFAAALPQLTIAQRNWLRAALDTAHPGHPWAQRL
jgi:hypothetical protein